MEQPETQNPVIVWFRQDLRLTDNPALSHAAKLGKPVIFLFIRDEISPGIRPIGSAQKWWLHHSLDSLQSDIAAMGGRLILRSGPAVEVIADISRQSGADHICWNRRYGEGEQAVDRDVKTGFSGAAKSFQGMLLSKACLRFWLMF